MLDLSTIDPAVIQARGEYASVNGEYKRVMSIMQAWAQDSCDALRHGLNEVHNLEWAVERFKTAETLSRSMQEFAKYAHELKAQKESLYQAAWGKDG